MSFGTPNKIVSKDTFNHLNTICAECFKSRSYYLLFYSARNQLQKMYLIMTYNIGRYFNYKTCLYKPNQNWKRNSGEMLYIFLWQVTGDEQLQA